MDKNSKPAAVLTFRYVNLKVLQIVLYTPLRQGQHNLGIYYFLHLKMGFTGAGISVSLAFVHENTI